MQTVAGRPGKTGILADEGRTGCFFRDRMSEWETRAGIDAGRALPDLAAVYATGLSSARMESIGAIEHCHCVARRHATD